ncbi:MAG: aminomethyl-transferring glycine dehydrogenase [Planctomycetes bacterium]|nr:aminomethyl-transferring glycine dehydrogenase [Planctomycetota bacterium]MBI3843652.1 aminomethyl-transferring glycine dehydrogenase [Planctomycetota bacterium]
MSDRHPRSNGVKGRGATVDGASDEKPLADSLGFAPTDGFVDRHIGPRDADVKTMCAALGVASLDELIDRTVPKAIRMPGPLDLQDPRGERDVQNELRDLASKNEVFRSFIGMGYHDCITPAVILRNVLENPGWYTQYTPYQAEISQGRLEAMLNYQTIVIDLTGLPVANSSLLDEATAAAEAMTLCRRVQDKAPDGAAFVVSKRCHPQTIEVVQTRASALGIPLVVGDPETHDFSKQTFGVLVQYPTTDGEVLDLAPLCKRAHDAGALVVVATDLLALTLLRAPGEFGADVAVGSSQRLGMPMGFGGPHAAFMATRDEFKRQLPGRIVGVSKDSQGRPALRLALQTREQHIRRDRATSNICTAQVLPAVVSSMVAVYHGPDGLRRIAARVHGLAVVLARGLTDAGCRTTSKIYFDTLRVVPGSRSRDEVMARARARRMNLRAYDDGMIGVALDETTTVADLEALVEAFGGAPGGFKPEQVGTSIDSRFSAPHARTSTYLAHPVFHRYRSETEMLRYMRRLESRDLSLTTSMIPLGSCTMKLNGTTEMIPVTWPGFAGLHPFAPAEQTRGYQELFSRLERWLGIITGFAGVSLQPNAGSQGEYAGLLVIRAYQASRGESRRNICLIPVSAHGTNPASAVLAGLSIVTVACDAEGNVDLADLRAKADAHRDRLAALMVTYPSTHGVFEEGIREICDVVHRAGGQVYLDGANMNAMVGLVRPADVGADVCHLNLHKTFCIPHGGGGPGMGPIAVAEHLVPFLPRHPVVPVGGKKGVGAVSATPWGSGAILPISYAYIALMGASGLKRATQVAILNANWIAKRLGKDYPLLFTGKNGFVAHECILDLRPLEREAGITAEDVAKRLMDYGFHAPTLSFPVAGTLMIEPTESESLEELARFCDAMLAIREEVRDVAKGKLDAKVNPLKMAPHTVDVVTSDSWDRPYSRERAAFPLAWTKERKFWTSVSRVDAVFGDRNVVCACPPIEAYTAK